MLLMRFGISMVNAIKVLVDGTLAVRLVVRPKEPLMHFIPWVSNVKMSLVVYLLLYLHGLMGRKR